MWEYFRKANATLSGCTRRLARAWPIVFLGILGTIVGLVAPWFQQESPSKDNKEITQAQPPSSSQEQINIPIIQGNYPLCPLVAGQPENPRWINFLYDVDENVGKTAFINVVVTVDCQVSKEDNWDNAYGRQEEGKDIRYAFRNIFGPQPDRRFHLDGQRDPKRLLVPDNGAYISIRADKEGRNAFSRLRTSVEGLEDQIYGPFLIKKSGEDGSIDYALSAPNMDSPQTIAISRIAEQLASAIHKK